HGGDFQRSDPDVLGPPFFGRAILVLLLSPFRSLLCVVSPMIGEQIENYRIIQHLGDGGMGTVFRAVDTMLGREGALKVLRPDLSGQADVTKRFRAEAVTLARLSHPHIATLFGLVRRGTQLCMVMEFVRGETLASLMRRESCLSWERASRLSMQ